VINHSCDPNAHVFFEGERLFVRSLKEIAAGEEITVCYIDPTLDVAARKALLKREYFFDCCCKLPPVSDATHSNPDPGTRCESELNEQRSLLGDDNKLPALHQAQREIINLISSAVRVSKYPGVYPDYDNLATVETKIRTITAGAFSPDKPWPDHMEPLPSARLSLAMLYLEQGKPIPALRNVLKARLFSFRKDIGPEWVNEMVDVVTVCIVAGSLPPDAAALEDKTVPSLEDIRTVTYGYLLAACHGVLKAFGGESEYSKGIQEMMGVMVAKRPGVTPGTQEFATEFQPAQTRVLAWTGVPANN
jgi:SET and MYND domain-containing protein